LGGQSCGQADEISRDKFTQRLRIDFLKPTLRILTTLMTNTSIRMYSTVA
jgi:hypothetical protein